MKEITDAIKTRQIQVKKLQADLEALQRAASALSGKKEHDSQGHQSAQDQAEAAGDECSGQTGGL